MDIIIFTQMLRNIDIKNQTIMGIMKYCWFNRTSGEDIVKIIEKETLSAKRDKKICYLYLLHEIMLQAQKSLEKDYVRYIGVKIKNLIIDFSKCVQSYHDANNVNKLIDRWNTSQIFAESFIAKLKQIMIPVCKKLLERNEANKNQKQFTKYSKTFLMDYNTIQDFEPTYKIYESYRKWIEIESKIIRFNQQYAKLDLKNPTTTDSIKRCSQLFKIGKEYRIELIFLIESFHIDQKVLGDRCKHEIEFIRENYQI